MIKVLITEFMDESSLIKLKSQHSVHYDKDLFNNPENLKKIIEDFGVGGSPRFYWLAPNTRLGTHVDNGTTCSINLILSENPAPVTILNVDMFYTQALLNTTLPHSVINGPQERVLLKISIFDKTFDEVSQQINYKK